MATLRSLDRNLSYNGNFSLLDLLASKGNDPLLAVESEERMAVIRKAIKDSNSLLELKARLIYMGFYAGS